MRTFIIDTDTASDDAVAIIMALRAPDVQVAAITVVAGNVPLQQATRNALYTVELCGASVPVYAGADKPLVRAYEHAEWFHGSDGFGGMNYPAPQASVQPEHAVPALIRHIRANPGCTLVTLGPLTNVALALMQAPDLAALVDRCVVMGGAAATTGNVTPAAEYNIYVDPEAADIVFRSGMAIEMVGWELCRLEANILADEIALIRSFDTVLGHFTIDCNRRAIEANREQSGDIGIPLPDPVAMAVALDPTIAARISAHAVAIDLSWTFTRGMTIVDQFGVAHDERNRALWGPYLHGKTQVVWSIDIPRWKDLLYAAIR